MKSKLLLWLVLVLSGMVPGSFGSPFEAKTVGSTNTNSLVWGKAAGGFQVAALLDKSNAVVHCWIRNATTNKVAFNDFYFGYVENVKFEIRLGTNWTALPSTLIPATPWSGSGGLGGKLRYAQPGQIIARTWSRRHAMYSGVSFHDTFAVDLIGVSWPAVSQFASKKLEARVAQSFYPASPGHLYPGRTPQLTLFSPTFILKTAAIRSFVNRFPRMPVGSVPTNQGSAAVPVPVAKIKITFAKPFISPAWHGMSAGVLYPPGWNIKERGPFTNMVAGRIAGLDVTWADPKRFKTENQTRNLLRELLCSTNTETWTFHVWSWGEGPPSVVAAVSHTNGKRGIWMIWCSPRLFWAYKDGNGKWWWGSGESWKASEPRSLKEP